MSDKPKLKYVIIDSDRDANKALTDIMHLHYPKYKKDFEYARGIDDIPHFISKNIDPVFINIEDAEIDGFNLVLKLQNEKFKGNIILVKGNAHNPIPQKVIEALQVVLLIGKPYDIKDCLIAIKQSEPIGEFRLDFNILDLFDLDQSQKDIIALALLGYPSNLIGAVLFPEKESSAASRAIRDIRSKLIKKIATSQNHIADQEKKYRDFTDLLQLKPHLLRSRNKKKL